MSAAPTATLPWRYAATRAGAAYTEAHSLSDMGQLLLLAGAATDGGLTKVEMCAELVRASNFSLWDILFGAREGARQHANIAANLDNIVARAERLGLLAQLAPAAQ